MDNQKLDTQLTTQDESGRRITVIPAVVKGAWYSRRKYFQWFLLFIFLILPWLEWNGKPLLLLNFTGRRFILFGLELWASDAPLAFFLFAILAFGLFFATAIWGRVWCGWACPQTVFIERVFRQIEIWIEGNHLQRRKLAKQEMSFDKFSKLFLKHSIFIGLAWYISNTFLAYFVGKEELFKMMATSPSENPTSFAVMAVFFGAVLFDFVWFREQFCTLVCPYGRFQSVLMDKNSLLVAYDEARGEPRGKLKKDSPNSQGDCIDCKKCVTVCPTGIDIRNGTQMECIACTACIDACDDVMEKIKKPKGLIRYSSERELAGREAQRFNIRTIVYSLLILVLSATFIVKLATKEDLNFQLLRQSGLPYQVIKNDKQDFIQNVVQIQVHNKSSNKHSFSFRLHKKDEALILINPVPKYTLNKNDKLTVTLILQIYNRERIGEVRQIDILDENDKSISAIMYPINGPHEGVKQ